MVPAGKMRRLTLLECGSDLNTMLDVAKIADLVLLLVDASFGFEMETFEFLNILQVQPSVTSISLSISLPLSPSGPWVPQGDGSADPPGHVPLSEDSEEDKEETQKQILDRNIPGQPQLYTL